MDIAPAPAEERRRSGAFNDERSVTSPLVGMHKALAAPTQAVPTLGERLRIVRVAQDLNQAEFARAISASQGSVSKWERGRETPCHDALANIRRVFGVNLIENGDLSADAGLITGRTKSSRREPRLPDAGMREVPCPVAAKAAAIAGLIAAAQELDRCKANNGHLYHERVALEAEACAVPAQSALGALLHLLIMGSNLDVLEDQVEDGRQLEADTTRALIEKCVWSAMLFIQETSGVRIDSIAGGFYGTSDHSPFVAGAPVRPSSLSRPNDQDRLEPISHLWARRAALLEECQKVTEGQPDLLSEYLVKRPPEPVESNVPGPFYLYCRNWREIRTPDGRLHVTGTAEQWKAAAEKLRALYPALAIEAMRRSNVLRQYDVECEQIRRDLGLEANEDRQNEILGRVIALEEQVRSHPDRSPAALAIKAAFALDEYGPIIERDEDLRGLREILQQMKDAA